MAHTNAPYHVDVGDLNNDGRPDMVITDDGSDRYRYNLGTEGAPFFRAIWSSSKTFQFLSGGDDGFGSNNLIADLDGDGWNDVLIADVDVDIGGYNRRLHIYHNPGGAVGSQITLVEERQSSSSNAWLGAVGLKDGDLEGTHDMAVFDVDNDGNNDLVISRKDGTDVWMNQASPAQTGLSYGNGSAGTLGLPGHSDMTPPVAGTTLMLRVDNVPSGTPVFIGLSIDKKEPALDLTNGILLNVSLPMFFLSALTANASGEAVMGLDLPLSASGLRVYSQGFSFNGSGGNDFASSLGLQLDIQ